MQERSDPVSNPTDEWDALRQKVIGLGERSTRKSYYPELQQRLAELERFRALLDHGNEAIFLAQVPSGRLVDVNESACHQLNYPRQELLALSLSDLVPAATLAQIMVLFQNKSGTGVTITTILTRRDGGEIAVETTVRVVALSDAVYAVMVARDITERQQAEEALRESERRFRELFENSPDAISVEDLEGNVLDVNPAACRLHKMTREQLVGKNVLELGPPDKREEVPRDLLEMGRGEKDQIEGFCWTEGGQAIPVEIKASRIEYSGGPAVLLHIRDITPRVRAEQLLRALNRAALAMEKALTAEELFTAIAAEFKPQGFSCMISRLDESQSWLFPTYLSHDSKVIRAVERLVGLKRENFSIPVDTIEVYRQVVREKQTGWVENVAKVLQQLLPEPVRMLAGQLVKILQVPKAIIAPLIVEEQVIGTFSVQADDLTQADLPVITAFAHQVAAAWRKVNLLQELEHNLAELKRTQEQLLQSQKMEAVGQLAGGVAHDFNNLLTAINGFAELMQLKLQPDDPLWEMTEKILDSGRRAADLVGQLLAFSRRQVIQPQVLNLNTVMAEMEKMLGRLIGEDIHLETTLAADLWPVKMDPTQIGQVIINLAVNARDAMPHGGALTIETANVVLDETYAADHLGVPPGDYVWLAVSDTGLGMSREVQTRIFEPFFTTKGVGQGTGLGLSTVYGIVKQSGGEIQLYSEAGQGTTFKIYLPRTTEAAQPSRHPEVGPEMPTGDETILLVEDDDTVRGLTRRVLYSLGYHLLEARSGEEALRLARDHTGPIHLLLTDVVLPGLGGKALAEALAQTRVELKVLYMSGYTDNAIARHGVLEPGVAFLQKPFSPKDLARQVRAVVDG